MNRIKQFFITTLRGSAKISESREILTPTSRDTETPEQSVKQVQDDIQKKPISDSMVCPYCLSKDFVRRGWRQKERERVQLYQCKGCGKTFTPQITKGKHYPLAVVLDAVSVYNLGYSLEETCRVVNRRSAEGHALATADATSAAVNLQPSTLATWVKEFEPLCRYCQMRPYVTKKYSPKDTVIHATLAHRQLYRYRFHRGKCELLIEADFKHRRFASLKEFLEMVPGECPHQYFEEGKYAGMRASEAPLTFSKTAMIVRAKQNFANRLCEFVLQSVKERKGRHEALQKFMLFNDSVTVATEVPVYIMRDDIEHMQTQLGFEMYAKSAQGPTPATTEAISAAGLAELPKLITGHIDILQIRNGMIHILDYKPNAEKERPIEQLTLYAMALSRLTGLRLFEFKCAWFDEKDYFEFYPLHVLHKPKKAQRRRKIETNEGVYAVNKNEIKVESIRPI